MDDIRAYWRHKWHKRQDRLKGEDRRRGAGRKPALDGAQRTRLAYLWDRGDLQKDIAEELGCSEATVRRTAHILGLPKRRAKEDMLPERTATPVALPWWEGGS